MCSREKRKINNAIEFVSENPCLLFTFYILTTPLTYLFCFMSLQNWQLPIPLFPIGLLLFSPDDKLLKLTYWRSLIWSKPPKKKTRNGNANGNGNGNGNFVSGSQLYTTRNNLFSAHHAQTGKKPEILFLTHLRLSFARRRAASKKKTKKKKRGTG